MLTGLLANALGWRRIERERHQRLQERLVFAARIDREPAGGVRMTDFQTAQLGANDRGWTTRGAPDERAGGANTYNAPHLRYRDYFPDMRVTVGPAPGTGRRRANAGRLGPGPARTSPAHCSSGASRVSPSTPLYRETIDAASTLTALVTVAIDPERDPQETVRGGVA